MGRYGTYWFNGPNGWNRAKGHSSNASAFRWEDTPMGKAEANAATLKAEYEKAYNEARTANEQRYTEILGGFDSLYGDTMSGLDTMGQQGRKDVSSGYNKAFSQGMQGLVSAGMANSTIVPSVSLNNARGREDAMNRLNEMLRREKLGYMNNITGNKLNFMERREDSYPNANMYTSLMNSYGNSMGNIGYATSQKKTSGYFR